MEVWEYGSEARPKVLSTANLVVALLLHLAFFLGLYVYAKFNFHQEEVITPIDLTVVVVENLDGNEDEPPPLQKPEPPPPPPPPKPEPPKPKPKPKEPEKPKELEQIVTNIVVKVEKKEKEEPKKEPPKKEEKKPEPPKKTKKELMEERIKAMRESAKDTKRRVEAKPQPNGRTDKKTLSDAEIAKLLNMGYKPGRSTNLAANEEQLCYSLIKEAFEAKWDKPPWTDTLKPMVIRVWFGAGGRIVNFKLEQSSGDAKADQSIRSAATRVGSVRNLTAAFVDKYRSSGVPIRFTVKPQ